MNHVFSFLKAKCHQSENRPVLVGERSACITLCCKFFCWDKTTRHRQCFISINTQIHYNHRGSLWELFSLKTATWDWIKPKQRAEGHTVQTADNSLSVHHDQHLLVPQQQDRSCVTDSPNEMKDCWSHRIHPENRLQECIFTLLTLCQPLVVGVVMTAAKDEVRCLCKSRQSAHEEDVWLDGLGPITKCLHSGEGKLNNSNYVVLNAWTGSCSRPC